MLHQNQIAWFFETHYDRYVGDQDQIMLKWLQDQHRSWVLQH